MYIYHFSINYFYSTNVVLKEESKSSNIIAEKETTTHSTSENTISESKIPINELYTLTYEATNESINLFYGFIKDGTYKTIKIL